MNFLGSARTRFAVYGIAILASAGLGYFIIRKLNSKSQKSQQQLQQKQRVEEIIDTSVMDPKEFRPFTVIDVVSVSHNTKRIRFQLPEGVALNIPIGKHVVVRFGEYQRSYTPVSASSAKGYFDLVVKNYSDGKVSPKLTSLNIGDTVDIRGFTGHMKFDIKDFKHIGILAAGSGITPMLKVLQALLEPNNTELFSSDELPSLEDLAEVTQHSWLTADDSSDEEVAISTPRTHKLSMIFANQTVKDILFYKELSELSLKHRNNFSVHFLLSQAPENWPAQAKGRLTKQLVEDLLPAPSPYTKILICGPLPFHSAAKQFLKELGYERDMYFEF